MFDIFQAPEIPQAPEGVDVSDDLRYIAFLLEFLAHKAAPGNLEFDQFRKLLKEKFHAS